MWGSPQLIHAVIVIAARMSTFRETVKAGLRNGMEYGMEHGMEYGMEYGMGKR